MELFDPPYKPKDYILGTYTLSARPVQWDRVIVDINGRDVNKEYAIPILYEGTCPYCSNLLEIMPNIISIKCIHCKKGEDKFDSIIVQSPFCEPGDFDKVIK